MTDPIHIGLVGLGRTGNGMHITALKERTDMHRVVAALQLRLIEIEKGFQKESLFY